MTEKESKKENKDIVYDINIEQKPIETLKDNIKKENISDIKIKNQSLQNNTNSYSKSFDSENKENKEKELINNINTRNNKNSKFKKKKEEIKMLIYDNKDKYFNKSRKAGLIQRANKMPELEPYSKYNFNNTLKKMKNKSIEKKAKDLLGNDKKETSKAKEKNKFINKLKEIEVKIEEINELKNKKEKEENKVDFKYMKDNMENIDNDNEKDKFINFDFNFKLPSGNSENKYQELKKLYFSKNKFEFNSIKKKYRKDDINKIINYDNNYKKKEEFKGKYINYNIQKLNKKNPNMIRIISNSDNFNNILDKLGKFEESKNDNKFKKSCLFNENILLNDYNRENRNRRLNKGNFDFFKSVSLEKSSKLRNMFEDVYDEIKDMNNYTIKRNFSHKMSNIKANIKYSTLNRTDKYFDLNTNCLINEGLYNKSNELNFDDLLKLCSKRNLKSLIKTTKFSL